MSSRRGGLGRGLAALIPAGEGDQVTLTELSLSAITPNPRQPRGVFDETELTGLADSIRDMGLLQPIVVRHLGDERYELIAGERRLRASKLAGLTRVPALVRQTDDDNLLKEALVENIQRVQLNPLEEAAAYQQLLEDFGVTQEELATRLGKSRPTITNMMRLLSLPPTVQRKVAAGVITAGHAKAILALGDKAAQERLADRVVAEGLSVRTTEEAARLTLMDEPRRGGSSGSSGGSSKKSRPAPGLADLQQDLSDALQTPVTIDMGRRGGTVKIAVSSQDELDRVVAVIAAGVAAGHA